VPLSPPRCAGLPRCAPAVIGALLIAACNHLPPPPSPVHAPAGVVDRVRIRAAGAGQSYDPNPGASDEDVLDSGAVAVIEPQVGVYQLDTLELAKGYVIGRFVNKSQIPVRRLGLAPGGTTYWFVYKGKDGKFVSAYISDSDSSGYDRQNIPMVIHKPSRPWRQSVAQWQLPGVIGDKRGMGALGPAALAAGGSQPWISCVTTGCCKPLN
jgi:hypothetical protein